MSHHTYFYWAPNPAWRKLLEKRLARAGIEATAWRTEMQLGRPGIYFESDAPAELVFQAVHNEDPRDSN